ncbi:TonB-dependent receptor [Lysobacter sp. BMK333-48F3]|uniref:TonB-dependent receptor domain-containing protein n=1 Tax=Lysobacter sp. BMK333-48F3 TaxID=2867962 RepID=UPI001C8C0073|nr:TonB-dependent receptor [Lysobacter sp. BMK333-48F3]MBX9400727.1 TonB-dependent receptor [Lysobacter sp. BMK333-48F3]
MSASSSRLLSGLALLACAPLAHAADAADAGDSARTLDTITVVAEREPGNFDLDRGEIELTQASDLGDLLSNESGVAVGGGSPVAQKVYVRGFEDTLLNVSIDGAQEPAELYHHQTRVQIEPEFIKSIELDAGAGAATAGAGALTGAMRVRTRDAFDLLRPGQNAGFLVKAQAGFNGENSSKGVLAGYGRLSDRLGLLATYVYQDGGDYDDGHGDRVEPTGYRHERAQAKLSGLFDAHQFDFSAEQLEDTGTYYERPHMTNFSGRFVLSDHRMRRTTYAYEHRFDPDGEALNLRFNAYRTRSDYQNRRNTTGLLYGWGEQTSTGFDLRNTSAWDALSLTYGVDYRGDRLHALQQATPRPFWGRTEQTAKVFGAYAQGEWQASPQWKLAAGLRWDDYRHQGESGVSAGARNDQAKLSPNLSLTWTPIESLSLRAAYSEAFRGVTIREAFFSSLYTHRGDLDGEQADNLEFGIAWERDGFFARATVFRQRIENYINAVYDGGAAWGYWENVGTAKVDGYEAELGQRWERSGWSLGVWNSDNKLDGRPLNDADLGLGTSIGRTWTARFDWQPASAQANYAIRARLVEDERNSIAPAAPDKPGYAVVDVMANWNLLGDDRLKLGAAINNLFDRFYYDHGTYGYQAGTKSYIGFPSPGRELSLSLTYRY